MALVRTEFVLRKVQSFLHFSCPCLGMIGPKLGTARRRNFCAVSGTVTDGGSGGNGRDPMFRKSLVKQCKKGFKSVQQALDLYHDMLRMDPLPTIVEFNQLTAALARMKCYSTILQLYKRLEKFVGILPNDYSLAILMNCYCQLDRVDLGFSVLGKIIKRGYEPDVVTFNTLLNGLAANGKLRQAMKFYSDVVKQGYPMNRVTINVLVNGFMNNGNLLEALSTYPQLVKLLCEVGRVDEAHQVLEFLFQRGEAPQSTEYETIICGYCVRGKMNEALSLFDVMINRGYEPDVTTYTFLITRCCWKYENVDKAFSLFVEMSERRLVLDMDVCYLLMDGLKKKGRLQESQLVLDYMHSYSPVHGAVN